MLTEIYDVVERQDQGADAWYDPARRDALVMLLRVLAERGYDFVTPTPATHARVLKRPDRQRAKALRDILGWSLPFEQGQIDQALFDLLVSAGAVRQRPDRFWSPTLRASGVGGLLFLHSAYPTSAQDAVFLGPDSHRFAHWIAAHVTPGSRTVLDYGAGAGVGGISAAVALEGARLTLADINPKALFLAGINAEAAGVTFDVANVREPRAIDRRFDLIVTHPPFMIDSERRAYRDGGDLYGSQLSLEWVLQGIERLAPQGQLILHTGVSIVDGRDVLLEALQKRWPSTGLAMAYVELDPDIFSEDLDQPGYEQVERIAAVGLSIRRTD